MLWVPVPREQGWWETPLPAPEEEEPKAGDVAAAAATEGPSVAQKQAGDGGGRIRRAEIKSNLLTTGKVLFCITGSRLPESRATAAKGRQQVPPNAGDFALTATEPLPRVTAGPRRQRHTRIRHPRDRGG